MNMEFVEFTKIPRLSRDMIITEKIDGTNAQITITESVFVDGDSRTVSVNLFPGSRHKFLHLKDDNYGFAKWCEENREELLKLGPGTHYGEWWGKGINRGYGLQEKRFSLFNTGRWNKDNIPECCDVVPVLYQGPFDTQKIKEVMDELQQHGSYAAPGFMDPEGIVVYHTAGNCMFKKTFKNDEGKYLAEEEKAA
jgi:hypothetical protein